MMGSFGPCRRWWRGNAPEWDLVAESIDGRRLLLGEVKWSARPFAPPALARAFRELLARPAPQLPGRFAGHEVHRALFVPACRPGGRVPDGAVLVKAADLLGPTG
jgi:hypothetical protein